MTFKDLTYRTALVLTDGTVLLLGFLAGAVGIMGAAGNPADLLYLVVAGVAIGGTAACRLRPHGMARTAVAAAVAVAAVAVVELLLGRHQAPVSSVVELLGLNMGFVALFPGAGSLFRRSIGEGALRRPAGTYSARPGCE